MSRGNPDEGALVRVFLPPPIVLAHPRERGRAFVSLKIEHPGVLTTRHGGCTFTLTPNAEGTQFPKRMARQTPTRLARKRWTCRRLAMSVPGARLGLPRPVGQMTMLQPRKPSE